MNAIKSSPLPGALLFGAGLAIGAGVLFFRGSLSDEVFGVAGILALVLIGWGIASLLWLVQAKIFRLAGPLMIFAGVLLLLFSWYANALAGLVAGGLLAIAGAILCLRK